MGAVTIARKVIKGLSDLLIAMSLGLASDKSSYLCPHLPLD
jgi:hypothetical protein